jgi:signal transduction histidine kinase
MGLRRRSIRVRIFLLILIPLLSLIGLYVFAASTTAGDAISEARAMSLKNQTGQPTGNLIAHLDTERRLAVTYLAAPSPQVQAQLTAAQAQTDQAVSAFHAAMTSSATRADASAATRQAITATLADLAGLASLRHQVAGLGIDRQQALTAYSALVSDGDLILKQVIRQETNASLAVRALALVRMGQSQEILMQEDAVLEGDIAARSFPPADRREFTELVGAHRVLLADALPDLSASDRVRYDKAVSPQLSADLTAQEDTLINDPDPGGPPPVQPTAWGADVAAVSGGLSQAGTAAAADLTSRAQDVADGVYLRLILAGGLGLVALLLSILVSSLIGRGLGRQLADLRRSALALAGERLPEVVARLRAGEDVDIAAAAPPMATGGDEIGQVSRAFNTAARTAVEAAVGQARLRNGIADVFRNLARRSQSLLHRQLILLDAMERRIADPDELADLYRLDHLTTRMRRHAEGLIILSGATPGRSWRNPVLLVDVLRAAVAEVEDYTRVTVATLTRAALAGPAVADVIHMIAELVENATIFSPPNTAVRLTGDVVGKGFAIEIEDRGLGLSEEKLAGINARLAAPPEFDLSDSDQLGLFVAGRLAKRHSIKVSLRPNAYGGTTAIVLIPRELVVSADAYASDPAAAQAGEHAAAPTGRHAARLASATTVASAAAIAAGAGPYPAGAAAPRPVARREAGWAQRGADDTWPGLRTAEAAAPTAAAVPTSPVASRPAPATTPTTKLGLPRRVRQASLAPQLRETGPHTTIAADAGGTGERSPEEVRAKMTAIQQGWERGRAAPAAAPVTPDAGPVPGGAATTAPGESDI